jgi:DNA polymerase
MPIDGPARHRLLLSLRSETALGLKSVRRGLLGELPTVYSPVDSDAADESETIHATIHATFNAYVPGRTETAPARPVNPVNVVKEPVPAVRADMYGEEIPWMKFSDMPSVVSLPVLSTEQKKANLAALNEQQVRSCTKCRLSETRTQTVFGEGDIDASIFFIGEGPGEDEDKTGRPFVGRSGQLLEKMIIAMGLSRSTVFIANIVKCRPPDNRVPAADEVETCTPYLVQQLEVVRPKVIVTLGLPAVKFMLSNPKLTMGSVRGRWQEWRGIKLMPTYHPSYVLRNYTEATRAAVWSDLQQVMTEVGLASKNAKR